MHIGHTINENWSIFFFIQYSILQFFLKLHKLLRMTPLQGRIGSRIGKMFFQGIPKKKENQKNKKGHDGNAE
jgi:hypothetical protein